MQTQPSRLVLSGVVLALAAGCGGTHAVTASTAPVVPDVPLSRAPFEQVHIAWKERLGQAYVYVEHRGDYRQIGRAVEALASEAERQDIDPSGPLFALFYDDPGRVPVEELRARACVPVEGALRVRAPLLYDTLPGTPVIYAVVAGPYADVPRAYPALGTYLTEHGWVEAGPWREIYLNSADAAAPTELLTEVQVPWRSGG